MLCLKGGWPILKALVGQDAKESLFQYPLQAIRGKVYFIQ